MKGGSGLGLRMQKQGPEAQVAARVLGGWAEAPGQPSPWAAEPGGEGAGPGLRAERPLGKGAHFPRCAPTCPPRPARLGLSTEHPGWSLSRLPDVATRAERCPRSLTLLSRPGAGNAEGLLRPLGGQPGADGN